MAHLFLPSRPWVNSIVGTVLILLGCAQLVYSTLAIVAALGIQLLEIATIGVQAAVTLSHESSHEAMGTDSGPTFIKTALTIGVSGLVLSGFSITGGILALMQRRWAAFFIGGVVLLCICLAYPHMLIRDIGFVVAYAYLVVGGTLASLLVIKWKVHHPQPPKPQNDAPTSSHERDIKGEPTTKNP